MLELRAVAGPTARLLAEMLGERKLTGGKIQGIVNYGHHAKTNGLPTLNQNAGGQNKYEELIKLDEAGVRTIPFSKDPADLHTPIFGRKFQHTRGRDITVFGAIPRQRTHDYYTQQINKDHEYRVWVFRGKALATYEKILNYPERNGRRGRSKEIWNWANGFAYKFVQPDEVSNRIKDLAIKAISALALDFGAVDLIEAGNWPYVLEVNTAPGTQGEARQGITSLVNSIERWAKNGFKARKD